MSGGEFLRAVMDASCVDGSFQIYTIEVPVPAGPPAGPIGNTLQVPGNKWFLAMAAEIKGLSTTERVSDLSYNPATITNPKASDAYSSAPTRALFWGGNLNGMMMFNDYMLFQPSELIGFNITNNPTEGTPLTVGSTICCTLYGVEYGMDPR